MALFVSIGLGRSVSGEVAIESFVGTSFITVLDVPEGAADQTRYLGHSLPTHLPHALLTWPLLGLTALPLWRYVLSFREARVAVHTSDDLTRLEKRAAFFTSWAAAPQVAAALATVASVDDSIWREAITRLSQKADLIVLDLTYPSEAVLWDLTHVAKVHPAKLLVVVRATDLQRPLSAGTANVASALGQTRLGAALLWDPSSPETRRHFHRQLRRFVLAPPLALLSNAD